MIRSRFRLDTVLRVRRVQARLAAAELGAAQQDEARAAAAEVGRAAGIAARPRLLGPHDTWAVHRSQIVWDAELASLALAVADHASAEARTDAERAHWTRAEQRARALELLDERHQADRALQARRAEAATVDDLVAGRYQRHAAREVHER